MQILHEQRKITHPMNKNIYKVHCCFSWFSFVFVFHVVFPNWTYIGFYIKYVQIDIICLNRIVCQIYVVKDLFFPIY